MSVMSIFPNCQFSIRLCQDVKMTTFTKSMNENVAQFVHNSFIYLFYNSLANMVLVLSLSMSGDPICIPVRAGCYTSPRGMVLALIIRRVILYLARYKTYQTNKSCTQPIFIAKMHENNLALA